MQDSPRRTRPVRKHALAFVALAVIAGAPASALELDVDGNGSVGPEDVAAVRDLLFTNDPVADVNGDGRVDFSDVALVKRGNLAVAEFASLGTVVSEDVGTLGVRVVLDKPLSGGRITYSVSGTASSGADYTTSAEAVVVGDEATLSVDVVDDLLIEPVEWLTLKIVQGAGYRVGAFSDFAIRIRDNDAVWHGTFTPSDGNATDVVGFRLDVLDSNGVQTGAISGAGGLVPRLEPPFDLASLTVDASSVSASAQAIPLPTAAARASADYTRSLTATGYTVTLTLDPAVPVSEAVCRAEDALQCANSADTIPVSATGTAVLDLVSLAAPHLNSATTGTYTLTRQSTAPSDAEVDLAGVE